MSDDRADDRPDDRADDLAQLDDDAFARHRSTQTLMQEAIAEVVARARGAELADVVAMVEAALAARGVPPQPPRWLEAVAMDAQQRRIYVEEPHLGAAQVLERYADDPRG